MTLEGTATLHGGRRGVRARAGRVGAGRAGREAQDRHRATRPSASWRSAASPARRSTRRSSPRRASRTRSPRPRASGTGRRPRRGAAARRRGRPRRSRSAPRPRTSAAGMPASLARTRSAAAATSSAIAIRSRRARARRRRGARASRRAARAPRTRSRRRSGRPATGARSCRRSRPPALTPAALRISARMPPRRGVGVLGQQDDASSPGTFEVSMPALAQIQPAVRLDDQDAALGADHGAALVEDELDQPRVLAQLRRQLRGTLARARPSARVAHASLRLRDDLLRDDERRRRAGERRARPPRAASPSRVASRDLGDALQRDDLEPAHAPAGQLRPARAPSPAPAPARRPAPPRSAARSSAVSRSRASDGTSSTTASSPRRRARSTWRVAAVRPERRARSRPAGHISSALVPVPWRSGTTATLPGASRASAASSSPATSSGQSPGRSATALGAERLRADDPEGRGLGVAVVVGVLEDLDRRLRALRAVKRHLLGPPLAGDDDHPLDQLGCGHCDEHVGEHRLRQRRPSRRAHGLHEALLRRREALHRDDRGRPHRRSRQLRATPLGQRPAPACALHQRRARRAPRVPRAAGRDRRRRRRSRRAGPRRARRRRRRSPAGRSPP